MAVTFLRTHHLPQKAVAKIPTTTAARELYKALASFLVVLQPAVFQAEFAASMAVWIFDAVAVSSAVFKAAQSGFAGVVGAVQVQPAPRAAASVLIVGSVGLALYLASILAVAALQSAAEMFAVQLPVAEAAVLQDRVTSQAVPVQAMHENPEAQAPPAAVESEIH